MTPTDQAILNARGGKALAGRWGPGMLAIGEGCCKLCYDDTTMPMGWDGPLRVVLVEGPWAYLDAERAYVVTRAAVPDMSDAATRGAFLDVVREAWGDPTIHTLWSATWSGWYVYGSWDQLNRGDHVPLGKFATESEALIAALECAPVTK